MNRSQQRVSVAALKARATARKTLVEAKKNSVAILQVLEPDSVVREVQDERGSASAIAPALSEREHSIRPEPVPEAMELPFVRSEVNKR